MSHQGYLLPSPPVSADSHAVCLSDGFYNLLFQTKPFPPLCFHKTVYIHTGIIICSVPSQLDSKLLKAFHFYMLSYLAQKLAYHMVFVRLGGKIMGCLSKIRYLCWVKIASILFMKRCPLTFSHSGLMHERKQYSCNCLSLVTWQSLWRHPPKHTKDSSSSCGNYQKRVSKNREWNISYPQL